MGTFILIDTLTSVTENIGQAQALYPNPASDEILLNTFSCCTASVITVYNSTGQVVYTSLVSGSLIKLQTANWSNGLYTTTITSVEKMVSSRFVVNHLQ
ncbi:MAG: T9SS type A sorting domain-containing protein [Bacteroidia bacterium]